MAAAAFGETGCAGVESTEASWAEGRTAVVWHPAGLRDCGRLPLVIFSHGVDGCATQSRFFTEELARRGYVVVAPNHLDATCGDQEKVRPEQSFAKPKEWTADTYLGRRDDLRAVMDFALAEPRLGEHIDAGRVAGVGHSLGGYSLMASAGAWANWIDVRYRALLLFSPYAAPFLEQQSVGQIRVPVMYQGGTLDVAITPSLRDPGGVYDSSNPTKYYVELRGAGHFAWTNVTCQDYSSARQCAETDRTAKLITDYGVAFLDQYVKGDPQELISTRRHPQLADYRMVR